MTALIRPDARLHASWIEAMTEFEGAHLDGAGVGSDESVDDLRDPGRFRAWVDTKLADTDPRSPRPAGHVPCSFFWIAEGEAVLGSLAIRHELNEFLLEQGGHIGYSVRPSARRRGHAKRALAAALPLARDLGIERVLVTCDEDNGASRATIEGAHGVYEDSRDGKRRYWIDLPRP